MKNPLIVALDVPEKKEAVSLARELKEYVSIYKIGPVLFIRYGPDIVKEIQDMGCNVFLDLKLYDIPNTVAGAVEGIIELGVSMLTVHISGGREMLEAAVKVTKSRNTKILGVTVLTSVANVSIDEILQRVKTAKESGLDGVIASPLEIESIRKTAGKNFLIVTPGVRPKGFERGDQKRTATPREAIKNGADYIVVGRPIIRSSNPKETAKQIISQLV